MMNILSSMLRLPSHFSHFHQLGPKAWKMGNFCAGNPLLLSAEEMAGRGPSGKAHAARIRAASMVKGVFSQ